MKLVQEPRARREGDAHVSNRPAGARSRVERGRRAPGPGGDAEAQGWGRAVVPVDRLCQGARPLKGGRRRLLQAPQQGGLGGKGSAQSRDGGAERPLREPPEARWRAQGRDHQLGRGAQGQEQTGWTVAVRKDEP